MNSPRVFDNAPPPLMFRSVVSSAPASRNPSRCVSPVSAERRATSAPASPRHVAKVRSHGMIAPRSPHHATRPQQYHAVFGNNPRIVDTRSAWPHQKVRNPEPFGVARAPEMCGVHAYAKSTSTLRSAGATTFGDAGKASRGVRPSLAPSSGPPIHSYAPIYSSFGGGGSATFGTPHATPRRLHPGLGSRSGLMGAAVAPRNASAGMHRLPKVASCHAAPRQFR